MRCILTLKYAQSLLTLALSAFLFFLFVDRQRDQKAIDVEARVAEAIQLGMVFGSSAEANRIYTVPASNVVKFSERRTRTLLENVLDMSLCDMSERNREFPWDGEEDPDIPGRSAISYVALQSLELLEIKTLDDFQKKLTESTVSKRYGRRDVYVDGKVAPDICEFVELMLEKIDDE